MAETTQPADYANTPQGWAQRWQVELAASREELSKWHEQGRRIVRRFRDERDADQDGETRWNLFTANVQTQLATLYGQTPKVSVSRRFADSNDDVARVAAEMLERILNSDIERDSDTFAQALEYALLDRLLPGFGLARVRYVAEFETVPGTPPMLDPVTGAVMAPEVMPIDRKVYECVETDYCHWQDVLWSTSRVWHEVRWLAFRAQMHQRAFDGRFKAADGKSLWAAMPKVTRAKDDDAQKAQPWDRVEVWEIWDKESRQVFWFVEGYASILDMKEDPYGLESFFPCPRPMLANMTTDKVVPRPDFVIAKDLYNQIDNLTTRIKLLEDAIRVAGVYDKGAGGDVGRLINGATSNTLIPVENWAAFAEKGGIRGVIDWLPLEQVVGAITTLSGRVRDVQDQLFQVTGMADIMRGASDPRETASAQGIKARFGSVRLQRLQDEVARFASDVQRLKAEIISKLYDVDTILTQANAQYTFDAEKAPQAAQLLQERLAVYRIEVKPEAVSLQDYAALKSERMEVLSGIASFIQAMGPLVQQLPGSAPFMLQMLQWSVSGLRGASAIEGVLDRAVTAAEQAQKQAQTQPQKPPPPDPKLLAQQLKGQQELAKVQADLQADLMRTQAEVQANDAKERQQAEWNTKEAANKAAIAQASRVVAVPEGGLS
ncbi:hypothetical protein [Corallococcus silvisoli]|uniref:hypothetical protein n=1 Tax=Corallococcus silvisoli TaxID=2697031 RepID=UPI001376AA99|nr:hypothetical protein [Corallococcus silvisoli]NBD11822.1 hypothetical protein [Corallococcus silvisoli]